MASNVILEINPRLTGGVNAPPPSRIFATAQKRTAVSTWNLPGLLIQLFDIVCENCFFEIRRTIFEIWSNLWRYYTKLLVQNCPNFAGVWKTWFLMKTQMENTKRREMTNVRSKHRTLYCFHRFPKFPSIAHFLTPNGVVSSPKSYQFMKSLVQMRFFVTSGGRT